MTRDESDFRHGAPADAETVTVCDKTVGEPEAFA